MTTERDQTGSPFTGIQLNTWLAAALNPSLVDPSSSELSSGAVDLKDIEHSLRSRYQEKINRAFRLSLDFVKPPLAEGDARGTAEGLSTDASIFLQIQKDLEDCHARFVGALSQALVSSVGISQQINSEMQLDVGHSVEAAKQLIAGSQDLKTLMELHLGSYEFLLDNLTAHIHGLDLKSRPDNHAEARRRRERVSNNLLSEQIINEVATPRTNDLRSAERRKLIVKCLQHHTLDEVEAFYCWFAKGLTQREIAELLHTSQPTVHRLVANTFPEALARLNGFLRIEEQAAELGLSVDGDMVFHDSDGNAVFEARFFNLEWPYPKKDVTHGGIYYPGYSSVHDDPAEPVLWVYPATYEDFEEAAPSMALEYSVVHYEPSELVPSNNATSILQWCSWVFAPTGAVNVILWGDDHLSFHPAGGLLDPLEEGWTYLPDHSDFPVDNSPGSVDDWFKGLDSRQYSAFLHSFEDEPPSLRRYLEVTRGAEGDGNVVDQ